MFSHDTMKLDVVTTPTNWKTTAVIPEPLFLSPVSDGLGYKWESHSWICYRQVIDIRHSITRWLSDLLYVFVIWLSIFMTKCRKQVTIHHQMEYLIRKSIFLILESLFNPYKYLHVHSFCRFFTSSYVFPELNSERFWSLRLKIDYRNKNKKRNAHHII